MPTPSLICIGGGNMARAIILGSIERRTFSPADFLVIEPDPACRAQFTSIGVAASPSIADAAAAMNGAPGHAQVILAVKPQSLAAVGDQWRAANITITPVVISILAGTPTHKVRAALAGNARVVRAMPNTPARIAQGATAVALGAGAQPGDDALSVRLFSALGPLVERVPEELMDAVTALSGSGPAYLFYLAQAMTKAGIDAGLPQDAADRLTRQTLLGSAALLAASPEQSAEALRADVTSKGGTTEAACRELDESKVAEAIHRAVLAARDRGRELASTP